MAELYRPDTNLPRVPDDINVAQFMLDEIHEARPDRNGAPCLLENNSGRPVHLSELKERTYGLANGLSRRYGLGEKDIAMLVSSNHIDYPVALWAIHRLGGIVSCSNPQFTADELVYQLKVVKVTVIIAHSAVLTTVLSAAQTAGVPSDCIILLDEYVPQGFPRIPTVADLIADGLKQEQVFFERRLDVGEGKEKIALLCWSSGTTGNPKAVAISHYAFIANILQMAVHQQVDKPESLRDSRAYRPGDVALGVLPFYHAAGITICLHLTIFCSMTLVVVPKYDFSDMLNSITRYRITHLILVPPQAIAFCKNPFILDKYDLSTIKFILIGAAPVSQEVQEKMCSLFPAAQIGQAYGMTEMTTTISMVSPMQKRGLLGSGGRLLPGVEARVLKADGSLAAYGEPGELVVRGPAVALGYFHNEKATRETFVDGWVHTGDEVILSQDQEVFVFDRLKELIKVRGFQVAPAELEGCLLSHPDVADSCVIGFPDAYNGELPLAYVVLSQEAIDRMGRNSKELESTRESIAKHVADRKARYKHLKAGVQFIDTIPKNGSGKILRRILRDHAKQTLPQETIRARL